MNKEYARFLADRICEAAKEKGFDPLVFTTKKIIFVMAANNDDYLIEIPFNAEEEPTL